MGELDLSAGRETKIKRGVHERVSLWLDRFRSDEGGAAFVFALVIFTLMIIMGGMAVDVARMEAQRIKVQQTMDRAALAAADLQNPLPAGDVVTDYFEKVGLDQHLSDVYVSPPSLNNREVRIETDAKVATMFLHMVGVNALDAAGKSGARETISDIEISLVVDVSGSMGGSNRLTNLKTAAKSFFDTVMDNGPGKPGLTSVSIIPYNAHVNLGVDVAEHVNFDMSHENSYCGRFRDESGQRDFDDTSIKEDTWIERNGHFQYYGSDSLGFETPDDDDYWCARDDNRVLMLHQTDPEELKTHIDSMWASGWTAIDQGMRWGAAVLDPDFEPILRNMANDTKLVHDVPNEVIGRPAAWEDEDTMKIIVLMTDGANTVQRDYPDWAKDDGGLSPVWWSQSAADASGQWYDGYYVDLDYADTPSSERPPHWRDWYRPRDPEEFDDDQWMGWHGRGDAVQLTYHDLMARFTPDDMRDFFWGHADYNTRDRDESWEQNGRPKVWDWSRHNNMGKVHTNGGTADNQAEDFCTMIKESDRRIQIFSVAFEAPWAGEQIMKKCASSSSHFYDVDGLDIVSAFNSIASQINQLKLTQ